MARQHKSGGAAPLPADTFLGPERTALRRALTRWFAKARRPLPWRETYDPYAVWISEIMLQQTQVDTVLDYHARWMARFPDPASVAHADEETVLKHWEGLGYYRRARNLHKAARHIAEHHGGKVPAALDALLALPGIGRYTAGAIRSIGHNLPAPLVDGNVARVLGRLTALEHLPASGTGQRTLWDLAGQLVPARNPREFNEGLMELGALVCTPRAPDCAACPLASWCRARALGAPEDFPPANPRPQRTERRGALLLLHDARGRVLLRRRAAGGLWAGLWEPPWYEFPDTGRNENVEAWATGLGGDPSGLGKNLGILRHGLTHQVWVLEAHAFPARARNGRSSKTHADPPHSDPIAEAWQWSSPEQREALPMSRLGRKALALLGRE